MLAVGIVIDDAVVVHENIFRHMEEKGYSAWRRRSQATKEIALAVLATTLSLVVIFLPIAFMSGRVGRFFFSFGVTSAVAILVSMLVSFTLTPMLCSRFLKLVEARPASRGAAHHSGGVYGRFVERPYLWTLRWSHAAPLGRRAGGASSTFRQPIVPLGHAGRQGLPAEGRPERVRDRHHHAGRLVAGRRSTARSARSRASCAAGREVTNVLTTIGDTTGRVTKAQGDVTRAASTSACSDLVEPAEDRRQGRGTSGR